MAAAQVYDPPPNWPPPPPGWRPPPGWQPDPSWGPPPEGWRLYKPANPNPFLRSFGVATALYLVVVLLLVLTVGMSSYQAGGWLARIVLIPGLATALLLRSRPTYWPVWKVALSVLAWAALFTVISGLGALSASAR